MKVFIGVDEFGMPSPRRVSVETLDPELTVSVILEEREDAISVEKECALTGDLRIVRMDHCTSPAKGGKEIFLLVERVTKKNIKIRFFELDDEEQEIWEGEGKFTELDVHHQYAIVFKTPAYRDPNIIRPVEVYMELVRPSDNARSEWKKFRYIPSNEFKPGAKRPRGSYDSSSNSYNSSSLSSNELPATIATVNQAHYQPQAVYPLPNANSWNQAELITEDELQIAMNDVDSDEFLKLFEIYGSNLPNDVVSNALDSPITISRRLNQVHIDGRYAVSSQPPNTVIKMEVSEDDLAKAQRTYSELRNFIKSADACERAPAVLRHHLGDDMNNRRTNALHVFIGLNRKEEVTFLLKMLVVSKMFHLTNVPNPDLLTPLHIAVICRNEDFVSYLLHCRANPLQQDLLGRTALHMAIQSKANANMFEMLLSNKYARELIDLENYEGASPLNFAIEMTNMTAIKLLCKFGANVNKKHPKNGFTPLRIAVENQYSEGISLILNHPSLEANSQHDFQNVTPFEAARMKQPNTEMMSIIDKFMMDNSIQVELKKEIEDEEQSNNEFEEEIDCKPELVDPSENIEVLYAGLKKMTAKCLDEVATILDESGKYQDLAQLLDLSHLLDVGIISGDRSLSRNLLQYAIEKDNVSILDIRNFLENLDEFDAVGMMDRMARELHALVKS